MRRSHRLAHALAWTVLVPAVLALLAAAWLGRSPGPEVFGPVPVEQGASP